MKKLSVVFLTLLLFLAVLPGRVLGEGCPTLKASVNPDRGPVGTKVTFMGQVAIVRSEFTLFWDNPDNGPILATGKADDYNFSGDFIVPPTTYGDHFLYLYAKASGATPGCPPVCRFRVMPTFALKPAQASPGSRVAVAGNGFPADSGVEFNLDGVPIGTAYANARGVIDASFVVPKMAAGNHQVDVSCSKFEEEKDAPKTVFNITPGLAVDNPAPTVGSQVKIFGDGFTPNSKVTVRYDDIVITIRENDREKDILSDDRGSFVAAITVPNSPASRHTMTAVDAKGISSAGGVGSSAALSMELEKELPPQPVPLTPQSQRFGVIGSQPVSFDWTDVKDASGVSYTLEVGKNLTFFPPVLRKKGLDKSEYIMPPGESLSQGDYYWRVRTVDGAGNESPWTVSPYPFQVGLIPMWATIAGGILGLILALYVLRVIFRLVMGMFRYY